MATMMDTDDTNTESLFSPLPPQLLALVLANIQPAERLGSMAMVCSAWRAAAGMATNSISLPRGPLDGGRMGAKRETVSALSGWLHTHAAAAAIDSLEVAGYLWGKPPTLQLPVQLSASLRSLDLSMLEVVMTADSSVQEGAALVSVLPPELSAITRLRLDNCPVGLSTLPAFTNLQELVLTSPAEPSQSADVASLLQLTHLHLSGGYAQDTVLGAVGGLTSLQELQVEGVSYTADGLAALPVSLTKLWVSRSENFVGGIPASVSLRLAPDSTPAVAALTALRWLEVDRAAGFSAALLQGMSSLQHLAVKRTPLLAVAPAAAGGGEAAGIGLAALDGMTQLQHLELPQKPDQLAAALTAADAAALTASSQLTCLIIDRGLVDQELYHHMFPQGWQLPKLKELRATKGLLGTERATLGMVHSCPKLERLDVGTAMPNDDKFEAVEIMDGWGCTACLLHDLRSLTSLIINVDGEGGSVTFWNSMANLTGLKDLYIKELDVSHFGDIVSLSDCQELTSLQITDSDDSPTPYFEMKIPEGEPPNIWRRLPYVALKAAAEHYRDAPNVGWDVEGAFSSMTRAAAQHSLVVDAVTRKLSRENADRREELAGQQLEAQQLRREVEELRKQQVEQQQEVAGLREELAEQRGKQQEDVAALQATVAAMGAQLQALLLKDSMQHG